MARSAPRRKAVRLIKDAISHPTALAVLGSLGTHDLKVLADANTNGELGQIAGPIFAAEDPPAAANDSDHPVGRVLAKLNPDDLRSLADDCPDGVCPQR
jgi:hypothetical protein